MKTIVKIALYCLVLCLLCSNAWAMENGMLKVGLKYGNNALFSARLQNYNETFCGSGYALGYYDAERSFVTITTTQEQKIVVTVDRNAYVSGGYNYEMKPTHYTTVLGEYHIQLDPTFSSYEEAAEVAQEFNKAFVLYRSGEYFVRIGNHASREESEGVLAQTDVSAYGASIVSASSTGVTVSVQNTDTILLEYDCGGKSFLGVQPLSAQGGKTVTWFNSHRYYGGFEYRRESGGYISVINVVPIEDYVKCVITSEMNSNWPSEALKAQTVCARTYAAVQTRHRTKGFDVCSTDDCQAYKGLEACTDASDAAAEATVGEYLRYEGKLLQNAVYYSSNGGASEACKNVWGGDVPYLQGRLDPYEQSVAWRIPQYQWQFTVSADQLSSILRVKGIEIGTVKDVYVSRRTETGNVSELTFEGSKRSYSAQREHCRTLLNGVLSDVSIRSMRFSVSNGDLETYYLNDGQTTVLGAAGLYTVSGQSAVSCSGLTARETFVLTSSGTESLQREQSATGKFTFSGSGWGHNVGMSQWGAFAMAEQGYSYRDILEFYYTGITVG